MISTNGVVDLAAMKELNKIVYRNSINKEHDYYKNVTALLIFPHTTEILVI